jgi:hypothetical protein
MILAVDRRVSLRVVRWIRGGIDEQRQSRAVDRARERVEHFIAELSSGDTVIIPTPVLAEVLVRANEGGPGLLAALGGLARMKVRPFSERAAIETAHMTREAILAGDKKGGSTEAWQKVKVDRQVIAWAWM